MSSITTLFRRNIATGLRERGWIRLADEFEREAEDEGTDSKQKVVRDESPAAAYVDDYFSGRAVRG